MDCTEFLFLNVEHDKNLNFTRVCKCGNLDKQEWDSYEYEGRMNSHIHCYCDKCNKQYDVVFEDEGEEIVVNFIYANEPKMI